MLKKETIEAFALFAGVSASDLEAKIKSESEEDITLRKVNVFTDDQLTERLRNEKTSSYNEGKTAGVEMFVKDKKKELNYEFEGKDFNSFLTHHESEIKKGYEKPDKKVTELTQDIERMKDAHKAELDKLTNEASSLKTKVSALRTTNSLMGILPQNTVIPKEDVITLFNSKYQVTEEEGKRVVKQNGETIKDPTTASPIDLNTVFTNWIAENKYVKSTPGRGGGNEGGDYKISANSVSSFQEEWKKNNPDKSLNDQKYQEDYAEWRKENKNPEQ